MSTSDWTALLRRLNIDTRMGELTPVDTSDLNEFEESRNIKLPKSYRLYCEVFGAGEFSKQFKIAVPGYKGTARTYSLEHIDENAHDGLEYEVYSSNPSQHRRGLFFATDILRSYHFFDPEDITIKRDREYAVYTLFSNFTVKRTCGNFWDFITEYCLGKMHNRLIKSPPPEQLFMPVAV